MGRFRSRLWDVFCRVVDNWGDAGVCWRLARGLAVRGQRVRLWIDAPAVLDWMVPGARQGAVMGVEVLPWEQALARGTADELAPADVWIEAFGCDPPAEFVAARAAMIAAQGSHVHRLAWINLEYLSAESFPERVHGLRSPVLTGPAAGWDKRFFYPGFTERTGGLLREPDLMERIAGFDRTGWLATQGIQWSGEQIVSLFCYEPPALGDLLQQLRVAGRPSHLLVTAGRAAAAVRAALGDAASTGQRQLQDGALQAWFLPLLSQRNYDELLWASDVNFVRGEDSLVRALWAGKPFVWQPYPQQDGVHRIKLEALLDWLGAPAPLRELHHAWSDPQGAVLPSLADVAAAGWGTCAAVARDRLLQQEDLVSRLLAFVAQIN